MLQGQKQDDEFIWFLYDEKGVAYGFKLFSSPVFSTFYYEFNLQGDIIGILDAAGTKVVGYTYDEWGKVLSITGKLAETIGQKNPLRYRGYYYDVETGFYLTGTRYYDPEIGRFINADGYVSTGQGVLGNNMFLYCANNPVNRVDTNGLFWETILDVVSLVASVVETIKKPKEIMSWIGLAADTVDLIPIVTGVGEATRAAKLINKADNVVDLVDTTETGWKVGKDITTVTRKGNLPSWSTVKSRYWKNEAYLNPQNYTLPNLDIMKKGRAPLVEFNGKSYPMELHHINPRRNGGSNAYENLLPLAPWEHDLIDEYRHFKP